MLTFSYVWLFILLPLPFIVRRLSKPYKVERQAVRAPFFNELVELLDLESSSGAIVHQQPRGRQIIAVCSWILLVAALARPQWIEQPVIKEIASRDLLLAVDLSGSMETEDFIGPDNKKVSRLAAVKLVLGDFLKRRQGDRVGLIFFGTTPFIQVPFTEDLDLCRELLAEAQVGMAGPKTAFGDSIGLAIKMFMESKVSDKLLIVLTDGNDTSSKLESGQAARIAAEKGITIHTVAVGDPRAVGEEKLDEELLRDVAKSTGGSYFWAGDRQELERIYQKIDAAGTHEIETVSYRPRRDLYFYPLAIALILSLLLHLMKTGAILKRSGQDAVS